MKKILYLCLLVLAGCTDTVDLTQQNAITEKMQDANSQGKARYTVSVPGAGSGKIYLVLPEDWGKVGNVVICTNGTIISKKQAMILEDNK